MYKGSLETDILNWQSVNLGRIYEEEVKIGNEIKYLLHLII